MNHIKFDGIELNGTLKDFLSKLIGKGYVVENEPFGDKIKIATLQGSFHDYNGLCKVIVASNFNGIVNGVTVEGEEYYSVDQVLEDFEFFKKIADSYNMEIINECDDYFDEDDIDSIRDQSLEKKIVYQRADKSGIMLAVGASVDDDTFKVTMLIFDGINSGDTDKIQNELENYSKILNDKMEQSISEHLVFNSIEMEGDIDDFVEALEDKGFRVDMEPDWVGEFKMATMRGEFMKEPCELNLISNDIGDITTVFVKRRNRKSFEVVKTEFYKLLEIYKNKYGEPSQLEESILDETDPIQSLRKEQCSLGAMFRVGNFGSTISMLVNLDKDTQFPNIVLVYADGINQGLQEDEDDDCDVDDIDSLEADDYYDDI